MTLADLLTTTPTERWRSLSSEAQERIGAVLLEWKFAELVGEDDGTETTANERNQASEISDEAFNNLDRVIEAEFPTVCWSYPDGIFYECRDRFGTPIGNIENAGYGYRFVPTSPRRKLGRPTKHGVPFDAVPPWAKRLVNNGGWGPVLRNATPATVKSDFLQICSTSDDAKRALNQIRNVA